jgi:DNA polymerase V
MSTYVGRAMEKLRRQKSLVGAFMIFIRTNYKSKIVHQYSNSAVVNLASPTSDSATITKLALKALDKLFKKGYKYQKAGIVLFNIVPADSKQYSLCSTQIEIDADKICTEKMNTMDKLNKKFGPHTIHLASDGIEQLWGMKKETRSPRYTTSIGEILRAK